MQMTGLPWAKYVVAAAALMGILTGPLIGFYAGARIIYVLGRERLLPPVFAQMSAKFGTPVVATAVQGVVVCKPSLYRMLNETRTVPRHCAVHTGEIPEHQLDPPCTHCTSK